MLTPNKFDFLIRQIKFRFLETNKLLVLSKSTKINNKINFYKGWVE